jgi:hypothetical protein
MWVKKNQITNVRMNNSKFHFLQATINIICVHVCMRVNVGFKTFNSSSCVENDFNSFSM